MGTSVGESLGGADFDGVDDDGEFPEAHEINVTPFIDVMLVLLIVFMVAAPLSTVDLPVDLPSSTASAQKKPDKPLYVTIKPDLSVAIGETAVKRVDLVRSLDATGEPDHDRRVFLRQLHSRAQHAGADRQGRLVLPEDLCRRLGLKGEVALVGGQGRFEIWNLQRWKRAHEEETPTYQHVASVIGL